MRQLPATARGLLIAASAALAAAFSLTSPSLAQTRNVPHGPGLSAPSIQAPPVTIAPPVQLAPSIQVAPAIQAAPAPSAPALGAPATAPVAVVPYCDKYPDQCRPHRHAMHAHAPHDTSHCACQWYDHNTRQWVPGQFARSCCR
jgi:hypothetical protein